MLELQVHHWTSYSGLRGLGKYEWREGNLCPPSQPILWVTASFRTYGLRARGLYVVTRVDFWPVILSPERQRQDSRLASQSNWDWWPWIHQGILPQLKKKNYTKAESNQGQRLVSVSDLYTQLHTCEHAFIHVKKPTEIPHAHAKRTELSILSPLSCLLYMYPSVSNKPPFLCLGECFHYLLVVTTLPHGIWVLRKREPVLATYYSGVWCSCKSHR